MSLAELCPRCLEALGAGVPLAGAGNRCDLCGSREARRRLEELSLSPEHELIRRAASCPCGCRELEAEDQRHLERKLWRASELRRRAAALLEEAQRQELAARRIAAGHVADCQACDGTGDVDYPAPHGAHTVYERCACCQGSGLHSPELEGCQPCGELWSEGPVWLE